MAIKKTRHMNRPNDMLNLFKHIDEELAKHNITNAEDLLRQFDNIQYPINLNLILDRLNLRLEERELSNDISGNCSFTKFT